jgi:predicted SprT family Zn-dependent metalloprotease
MNEEAPLYYCYFCRRHKNPVKKIRLRFGVLYVCRECALELKNLLSDFVWKKKEKIRVCHS